MADEILVAEGDDEADSLLRAVARAPERSRGAGALTFDSEGGPRLCGRRLGRGDTIDRYVLRGEVGAGGMGVVYEAYDPELDRKVALKLVRNSPVDDGARARAQARLLGEARAMARLSHVNVVAVFDAGTFEGHVFLAMELVAGKTLREWLRAEKRSEGEILDVLGQAAKGLGAAHAAGLVHRDFKPDNVLIGDDRRARVADFGLAQSAAAFAEEPRGAPSAQLAAGRTATATVAGTPAYMAPEQLLGASADARTDQFAFCVTLYEALTGRRPPLGPDGVPFFGSDGTERPRIPASVRGALARGLAARPDERYESIGALVVDLERARRNARIRRFAPIGLAALALMGTVVGVAWPEREAPCQGAARRLAGAWDDSQREALRAAFTASGSRLAVQALATVTERFDEYAADWARGHERACTATRVRREQSEALLDLRMECLDQRRRELGALVEVLRRADAVMVEKAVAAAYRLTPIASCDDLEALRAPVPPPTDLGQRARVEVLLHELARVKAHADAARYVDGLRLAGELVARARALGYRPIEAEALLRMGVLETATDAYARAEASLQSAVWAALAGRDDRRAARAAIALAAVIANFASRHADAWRWSRFAEAFIERLGASPELEARHLVVLASLRKARRMSGVGREDEEDALSTLRRALVLTERAHGPEHPQAAAVHHNLGGELLTLGRYAEAERHHRESLRITEKTLGADHPELGWTLVMLADVLRRSGRGEAALVEYRRALGLLERGHSSANHRTGVALNNIADLLKETGRLAEAIPYLKRALALHEKVYGPLHSEVAIVRSNLAEVHLGLRDDRSARVEAERAARAFRTSLGGGHVYLGYPLTTLGRVALRRGDAAGARATLEEALAIRRGREADRYEMGTTRFALARALWRLGVEPARALRLARSAEADFASVGPRGQRAAPAAKAWLRGAEQR